MKWLQENAKNVSIGVLATLAVCLGIFWWGAEVRIDIMEEQIDYLESIR